MRILYIAEKIPYPIYLDGGTLMNYHVLQGLKKNHVIDFISFSQNNIPDGFIEKLCHTFYDVAPNSHLNKTHYIKSVLNTMPPFHFNKSVDFIKKIDELIQNNNYDVVFTDSIYMEIYTANLVHPCKVISLHDSISLLYKTFSVNTDNIFNKIYYEYCSHVFKKYELRILKSYSKCFFVSDKDEKYLINGKRNKFNTCVIPNGYNIDLINIKNGPEQNPNTIVFSGIMDYKPNIDAVLFFVKFVFPLILKMNADVKFFVIGKNPSKEIQDLARENIIVTGWVENIAEYIGKGTVYVSPLVSGAGLKNKIIEAMALKIAIVATSISVDGLEIQDNVHLYVADSPEIFARRVIDLIDNKDIRENFVSKSYDLIIEKYNWEKIITAYEKEMLQCKSI